mgnify:CR=1 FL=1
MTDDPVGRAREAAGILDSAVFKEAVAAVEKEFVEAAADDHEATIEFTRHVRALRAVVATLNQWALTGRLRAAKQEASHVA